MAAQRERIFAALFARLQAIQKDTGGTYFVNTSRVFQSFDTVEAGARPALFLVKGDEVGAVKVQNAPSGWLLRANVILYLQNADTTHDAPSESPDVAINEAITKVEAALELQPGEARSPFATFPQNLPGQFTTTLGGLCYSCQIVGTVEVSDGSITGTAIVNIPLDILTTG